MTPHLRNEKGSVMLLTMMFILIITVMGLIATQTSVFEIKIAENNRRYSEEFAAAELALNHAIVNFRNQDNVEEDDGSGNITVKYDIARLLNDTRYPDFKDNYYVNDSSQEYTSVDRSLARIEIRRIVRDSLECQKEGGAAGDDADCGLCKDLTSQANSVPDGLPHRRYDGSIDKRRFAVTATAYKRSASGLSSTWVQKGVSIPVEQDRDLF